jgi:hypothetical protein
VEVDRPRREPCRASRSPRFAPQTQPRCRDREATIDSGHRSATGSRSEWPMSVAGSGIPTTWPGVWPAAIGSRQEPSAHILAHMSALIAARLATHASKRVRGPAGTSDFGRFLVWSARIEHETGLPSGCAAQTPDFLRRKQEAGWIRASRCVLLAPAASPAGFLRRTQGTDRLRASRCACLRPTQAAAGFVRRTQVPNRLGPGEPDEPASAHG